MSRGRTPRGLPRKKPKRRPCPECGRMAVLRSTYRDGSKVWVHAERSDGVVMNLCMTPPRPGRESE